MIIFDQVAGFGQTCRRHSAFLDELGDSLLVHLRPVLMVDTGSEQACILVVIESADEAVDPSKAESFFDGIFVGDARFSGALFEVDEPDFFLGLVVFSQPGPPLVTLSHQ